MPIAVRQAFLTAIDKRGHRNLRVQPVLGACGKYFKFKHIVLKVSQFRKDILFFSILQTNEQKISAQVG